MLKEKENNGPHSLDPNPNPIYSMHLRHFSSVRSDGTRESEVGSFTVLTRLVAMDPC